MFVYRFLADLPTDLHKFEIEEDRHIFEELRSVCHFADEFDELKYSLKKRLDLSIVLLSLGKFSRRSTVPSVSLTTIFNPGISFDSNLNRRRSR